MGQSQRASPMDCVVIAMALRRAADEWAKDKKMDEASAAKEAADAAGFNAVSSRATHVTNLFTGETEALSDD
jgi:hypothetical protein